MKSLFVTVKVRSDDHEKYLSFGVVPLMVINRPVKSILLSTLIQARK